MKQPVEEVVWTGVVWGAADQDVYSVAVVDGRTDGRGVFGCSCGTFGS